MNPIDAYNTTRVGRVLDTSTDLCLTWCLCVFVASWFTVSTRVYLGKHACSVVDDCTIVVCSVESHVLQYVPCTIFQSMSNPICLNRFTFFCLQHDTRFLHWRYVTSNAGGVWTISPPNQFILLSMFSWFTWWRWAQQWEDQIWLLSLHAFVCFLLAKYFQMISKISFSGSAFVLMLRLF
jgi:hypothetical protein